MAQQIVHDYVHPPFHYLMLHGFSAVFSLSATDRIPLIGSGEGRIIFGLVQARLLSAAFSSLAVIAAFFLARVFYSRRAALISSLLLAISQQAVVMAQEARPYALLSFLALTSSYLFVLAIRERRAICWWGFVATGTLMIYTHYYGVLVIATLALYGIMCRKSRPLPRVWVYGGVLTALILYAPWLTEVLPAAANSPKKVTGLGGTNAVHWFTPLVTLNAFNNGQPKGPSPPAPGPPHWAFIAGGLLLSLPVALALKRRFAGKVRGAIAGESSDREGTLLAALLCFVPYCAVIGAGFVFHLQFQDRYLLFCAPLYYILAASEISKLRRRWALALLVAIVAFSAISLRANYFTNWKSAGRFQGLAYVEGQYKERDCGAFAIPFFTKPVQWRGNLLYRPALRVSSQDDLMTESRGCERFWLVFYARHKIDGHPLEATYSRIGETVKNRLIVVLYARKDHPEVWLSEQEGPAWSEPQKASRLAR